MAITMVLALPVVFTFFALAFDAGIWYFDHRTAQNESDSAALAAAVALPASDTGAARTALQMSLTKNGLSCVPGCFQYANGGIAPICPSTGECVTAHFEDLLFADGQYDRVTVLVRRPSPIVFSSLAGATSVWISASATSTAGPADVANVVPWGIAAPDPDCDLLTETCHTDLNADGDYADPGECDIAFASCPFGLNPDRVYSFKAAGGGNTGVIGACNSGGGNGANDYRDCLEGSLATGFFQSGGTVVVGSKPGSLGQNTDLGLKSRFREEVGWTAVGHDPWHNSFDAAWAASPCNVKVSPTDAISGFDPDGRARAVAAFGTTAPQPYCHNRAVLVPILRALPGNGGGTLQVVGVATFGIARWDYESAHGMDAFDADNDSADAADDCQDAGGGGVSPSKFDCGMVWGYLLGTETRPPEFLLQRIGAVPNPLAPTLIALVE